MAVRARPLRRVLFVVLLISGCGSGWKGPQVPVEQAPRAAHAGPFAQGRPSEPLWTYRNGAFMQVSPRSVGRLLMVADVKGQVHFIDPNSGRSRARIKGKGPVLFTPIDDGYRLFLTSGQRNRHLQAFDLKNGKRIWYRQFSQPPQAPIIVNEELWVPVLDTVYVVSPQTGDLLGARRRGGDMWLQPVVTPRGIVVLGRSGLLTMIDPDGREQWSVQLEDTFEFPPAAGESSLWLSGAGGSVWQFDLDGNEQWHTSLDSVALFPPVPQHDQLFVAGRSGSIWALQLGTGAVHWEYTCSGPVAGPPVADDAWLAVTTLDGHLWLLDPQRGETTDSVRLNSILPLPPVWAFGRLYVTDSDRTLHAFGMSP